MFGEERQHRTGVLPAREEIDTAQFEVKKRPAGKGPIIAAVIIVLIVGAVFLGWQYYASRPSVQASRILKQAQESYQQEDYAAAASSSEEVLKIDPSNVAASTILIDSYARQGSYAAMETAYQDLESRLSSADKDTLRSKVTGYLTQAAQAAENEDDYDTALKYYEDVVTIAGEDTDLAEQAQDAIASIHEEEARNADGASAIDAWKEVLEADPDNIEAWTALAREYETEGDTADAESAYQKLIELDPQETTYYESLASVFAGAGEYDQAISTLKEGYAKTKDTSLSARITEISVEQARAATGEEAISLWKKIIEDNPKLVDAYSSLADVYITQDEQQEALEVLQQGAKATGDALLQQRVAVLQKQMEQQGLTSDDIDGNLAQQLYLALEENRYNRAVRIMARKEFQDLMTEKSSDADDTGEITIDSSDFDEPVASEEEETSPDEDAAEDGTAADEKETGAESVDGGNSSGKDSQDTATGQKKASGAEEESAGSTKKEDSGSEDADSTEEDENTYEVTLTLDAEHHAVVTVSDDGTRIVSCWPAQTDELGRVVIGEYGEDENGYGRYVLADGSELSATAYFASFAP